MQYSQRDPNRDHVHGRVYRLVATGRPLLKPVTQYGKSVNDILEQFRDYEWRTRYRARRELHDRPAAEVLPVVNQWVSLLNPSDPEYDRLRCEALWVQQGHHAVDPALLDQVLAAKTPDARAAAVRIAADERDWLPDVFRKLQAASQDDHPRVRAEAARGLSFYSTPESVNTLLAMAAGPTDYWLSYTIEAALAANEPVWRAAFQSNTIATDNPAGRKVLASIVYSSKAGAEAAPFLNRLLSNEKQSPDQRGRDIARLAVLNGNVAKGRDVFVRNCTACHKVGNGEGQEFGPNLERVATRLTRSKLVESVIDPNADVDPKYLSTRIVTIDGKTLTGLVVAETPTTVTIFDGKEKHEVKKDDIDERVTLKQSSMPEGLAGTMAPAEFLDLMEYLASLK
jgi:putative heme-binding domain-containing protein